MNKEKATFWVTNISNRNVVLADLALTIPAYASVNLLDDRHYHYTQQQLEKSAATGSIYAKRDKIKRRNLAPDVHKSGTPMLVESHLPSRERSTLKVEEEHYEELQVTDEEYLEEEKEDGANKPVSS